jgi:hypothetical protein
VPGDKVPVPWHLVPWQLDKIKILSKKHLEIWKIVRIFAARYNNLKQFGR